MPGNNASNARVGLAAIVTGIGATCVVAWGIGTPEVWRDEAVTAIAATRSWDRLAELALTQVDAVHALYYSAMHVWLSVAGVTPLTLRLPSAAAVGLAAGLLVLLGREVRSLRMGVIAAVVLVALPRANWAATEARAYGAVMAMAVLAVLASMLAMRRRQAWWWLFAASVALGAYLFLYLVLLLPAVAAALACAHASRSQWRGFALACAGAAAATVPLVVVATGQAEQVEWIGERSVNLFGGVFATQWFLGMSALAVVVWWIAVACGVGVLARRAGGGADRLSLALIVSWLVVPTLLMVAVSVLVKPLYVDRYAIMSVPAMALAVAAGIDALPRWPLRVAALMGTVALGAASFAANREADAKGITWEQQAAVPEFSRGEWVILGGPEVDSLDDVGLERIGPGDALVMVPGADAVTGYRGAFVLAYPEGAAKKVAAARVALDQEGRHATWSGLVPVDRVPVAVDDAQTVWVGRPLESSTEAEALDERLKSAGFVETVVLNGTLHELVAYTR